MSELFKYTDFPDEPAEYKSAEDEIAHLCAELAAAEAERDEARRQVAEAQARIAELKRVAHKAIGHVGVANYPKREAQAHDWIDNVTP